MLKSAGFLAVLFLLAFGPLGALEAQARPGWVLSGAVLPGPSEEKGHYEVGLFPVLGGDGLPVGYPLVQEILPAGRATFHLRVPARLSRAYLFAELVEEGTGHRRWIVPTANPWTPSTPQPAELFLRVDGGNRPAAPAATAELVIRGTVGTLFAPPGAPLPQSDVEVRVRGRRESTRTNAAGAFALALPRFRGRIALEFQKAGYHPAVVPVGADDKEAVRVDLASRSAVDQLAQHLGLAQGAALGVILGRATAEGGAPLAGLTVRLSRPADGPFYFDDRGVPVRDLPATTADGRFLFLNVQPGSGFLDAEVGGEAIAPVRFATAEGGELLRHELVPVNGTLSGRIYQAVKKGGPAPLAGARVRIEGSSEWTTTDSLGAFRLGPLKWSRGERISVMFSASNFQNHRYQLAPGEPGHKLYAFPARYLETLAESREVGLDPASGLVVGRTIGPSVRMDALSEAPGANPARDFYFDEHGRMQPSPAMTDPRFGTYMIFNVPAGHAHLLGSDADGKLRFGKDFYSGPGVVSVEVDGDR